MSPSTPAGGHLARHGSPRHGIVAELAAALLAAGFRHVSVVPGAPATSLQEALADQGAEVLDVGNERSALELAFGWSTAGVAALCVVKGNGAWVAAETLHNAAAHGIGAPLLLLVGDDARAGVSTIPTDVRSAAISADVPLLEIEPSSLGLEDISAAAEASLLTRRPVVVRFTTGLGATPPSSPGPTAEPTPAAPITSAPAVEAHRWTKRSRSLAAAATMRTAAPSLLASTAPRSVAGTSTTGVVAVGSMIDAVAHLEGSDHPALLLRLVHPFPDREVVDFCRALDRVVVAEEGLPVVEDLVQLALARAGSACSVAGQRTGHLPSLGPTDAGDLEAVLRASPEAVVRPVELVEHPDAQPTAFEPVLAGLAAVAAETGVTVHTCVGSCIAAAYPPHSFATTSLELGAAIAVAAGVAHGSQQAAVALIGDYGLVHSALEDHDLVHRLALPVLTVVLADGRSEKTGGQPSAVSRQLGHGRPLDLQRLLTRAAEGARVRVVAGEALDDATAAALLADLLGDLPQTVVVTDGTDVVYGG